MPVSSKCNPITPSPTATPASSSKGSLSKRSLKPHHRASTPSHTPSKQSKSTKLGHVQVKSELIENDELIKELVLSPEKRAVQLRRQMIIEKELYPASAFWAVGEQRLFEALFMRQVNPVFPSHWTMDFSAIPMPMSLFARAGEQPIIYSRIQGADLKATRAFIRVFELTTEVRTLIQSGHMIKVPSAIRAELNRYMQWAAFDGGYERHDVLATVVIEVISPKHRSIDSITRRMQKSLRAAGKRHRDMLRTIKVEQERGGDDAMDIDDPPTAAEHSFRRRPPVIYGLFIVHATVLVLSLDSMKGDEGPISYHVEINLNAWGQNLWNAITVAIPMCMARDDMMTRFEDFERLPEPEVESDPDL